MTTHPTTHNLIDYLHGELEPAADAALHGHLASCSTCHAELEIERNLSEAIQTGAALEAIEFPSTVKARVWQAIRDAQPGPFARLAMWFRPIVAVPVAAALVLGIWFASPLRHGGSPGPMVAASFYLEEHAAQQAQNPFSTHTAAPIIETTERGDATDTEFAVLASHQLSAADTLNVMQ